MAAASYDHLSAGWGWDSGLAWTLAASVLLHLMVLAAGFVVYPALNSRPRSLPPIYTVSLVSLPGPAAPAAKMTAPAVVVPPQEKIQPVPIKPPVPEAVNFEKTKKKTPEVPPPKTEDALAEIDRALARVKGELQEKTKIAKGIDKAVDRLARQGSGSGQSAIGLRGTGPAGELDAALRDYLVVIVNIINARWSPPAGLIQKQGPLVGTYIIQITRSGGIQRGWFESPSGDRYLDQSVEKAVVRSNPLPPLPQDFKEPYFELGLRYTETGIANR
jgi:colicin import membrane protein